MLKWDHHVLFQNANLQDMSMCSLVDGYQWTGEAFCIHLQGGPLKCWYHLLDCMMLYPKTWHTYHSVTRTWGLVTSCCCCNKMIGWKWIYSIYLCLIRSQDGVIGIATSYGLDDRGVRVRVPVGSRIFSSPNCPDRLWGPPNLLSTGYLELSPQG
jgi:hypothetical protein